MFYRLFALRVWRMACTYVWTTYVHRSFGGFYRLNRYSERPPREHQPNTASYRPPRPWHQYNHCNRLRDNISYLSTNAWVPRARAFHFRRAFRRSNALNIPNNQSASPTKTMRVTKPLTAAMAVFVSTPAFGKRAYPSWVVPCSRELSMTVTNVNTTRRRRHLFRRHRNV